ncbi:hypothetical protein IE53DRAFT_121911 [Violaceomyces palustris]|uniref:Uncharacterized protein n=1 Tax=Violaceomyces palustris TaxID=1673888 RepID=A0ACD0P6Y0_9BASI|nr:hypothetical protein IE53DRAFT_121911 [Violaceomyces palustris]
MLLPFITRADHGYTSELLRSKAAPDAFPPSLAQGLASPQPSQETLGELEKFIRELFYLPLPGSFYVQMLIVAICILVMLGTGSLLILHRMVKGRFWIMRFTRRAEGTYIVPNALNCFLLFEGCFGIIWVAFAAIEIKLYRSNVEHFMHQIHAWRLLTWIPLWIGAFLAGWGSFYSAPGALDRAPSAASKGKMMRGGIAFMPRPWFINMICIGAPFFMSASLIAPAVLGQRHLSAAFGQYLDWSAKSDMFLGAGANPSSEAVEAWVSESRDVWASLADSYRYEAIGFTVWSVWAGLHLTSYIPAGGYLVYLVLQQVKRQKANMLNLQNLKKEEKLSWPNGDQETIQVPNGQSPAAPSQETERQLKPGVAVRRSGSAPVLFRPLVLDSKGDMHIQDTGEEQRQECSSTAVPEEGLSPPVSPKSPEDAPGTARAEARDMFFPPLRPDVRKQAEKRLSSHVTPTSKFRYLRRCFINLVVLYCGVMMGGVLYLFITARLAARVYEVSLMSGHDIASLIVQSDLPAAWGALIFGAATVGSIWTRNFDPASGVQDSKDDSRKGKKFERKSKAMEQKEPLSQAKTRTLPPVPESVVAIDSLNEQSTIKRSGINQGEGGGGAIKFALVRDNSRPGAIVMRPTDLTGSNVSFSSPSVSQGQWDPADAEEMQTSTQRSGLSSRGVGKMHRFGPNKRNDTAIAEEAAECLNDMVQSRDYGMFPVSESFQIESFRAPSILPVNDATGTPPSSNSHSSNLAKDLPKLPEPAMDGTPRVNQKARRKPPSRAEAEPFSADPAFDDANESPASLIAKEWTRSQLFANAQTPTSNSGEDASQELFSTPRSTTLASHQTPRSAGRSFSSYPTESPSPSERILGYEENACQSSREGSLDRSLGSPVQEIFSSTNPSARSSPGVIRGQKSSSTSPRSVKYQPVSPGVFI